MKNLRLFLALAAFTFALPACSTTQESGQCPHAKKGQCCGDASCKVCGTKACPAARHSPGKKKAK